MSSAKDQEAEAKKQRFIDSMLGKNVSPLEQDEKDPLAPILLHPQNKDPVGDIIGDVFNGNNGNISVELK